MSTDSHPEQNQPHDPAQARPTDPSSTPPPTGYGQPYGYGPQPYEYPAQHYSTGAPVGPSYSGYVPPVGPYGYPPSPVAPAPGNGRRWGLIVGGVAVVAAVALGVGVVAERPNTTSGTALAGESAGGTSQTPSTGSGSQPSGQLPFGGSNTDPFGSSGGSSTGSGSSGAGSSGSGSSGAGSSGSSTTGTTATTKQEVGVVDVDTVIDYGVEEAAGTGLILDSTGDIVTNNHVIDGATQIQVTIVATGKTYTATVVGTSPTNDVAVIHLANASGLSVANFGDSSTLKVGDSVTGVGNAGGVGGVPSAAAGSVTALNQKITASDESGGSSEKLTGVIATNAPIKAGDSGGPLFNSSDEVVGIDTAASSGGQTSSGFSIPINHALKIASEIESGVQTSSIHIGYPGFLGVTMSASTTQLLVAGLIPGAAAAKAGIVAGDVITEVNGKTVGTQTELKSAISAHEPGSKISVTFTDTSGTSHTVSATLVDGPAD